MESLRNIHIPFFFNQILYLFFREPFVQSLVYICSVAIEKFIPENPLHHNDLFLKFLLAIIFAVIPGIFKVDVWIVFPTNSTFSGLRDQSKSNKNRFGKPIASAFMASNGGTSEHVLPLLTSSP